MKLGRRLRRHLSPLAGDSVSTLDLPPVRMGLLTKLNVLTVGLIFLTAVALSVLHFAQQWREDKQLLQSQSNAMLGVIAQLAEHGIDTSDKAFLEQMLDSVGNNSDVAYAIVFDGTRQAIADRRFSAGLANEALPPLDPLPAPSATGKAVGRDVMVGDKRYIEFTVPVAKPRPAAGLSGDAAPSGGPGAGPIGYMRLGMTQEVQRRLFREQMVGAIAVVLALLVFAILATLLLTRRLVAPMHRLMRAARAVGAGRLDVYVPASSSDELGLADPHVQPHDAKARRIAVRGRQLPADAGGQGGAADQGTGNRDRPRVQAGAARHPHRPAEPVAAQPAPEADHFAGAARRPARRVPVPRLRSLQAHQRHAGPRRRRPAAAGHRAAADQRRARKRHGRALGRRRVRRRAARTRSGAGGLRGHGRSDACARIVHGAVPPVRPDAHAHLFRRRGDVPDRRDRTAAT